MPQRGTVRQVTDPLGHWEVPYQYTTANGQTFKDSHEHPGMKLTTTTWVMTGDGHTRA